MTTQTEVGVKGVGEKVGQGADDDAEEECTTLVLKVVYCTVVVSDIDIVQ